MKLTNETQLFSCSLDFFMISAILRRCPTGHCPNPLDKKNGPKKPHIGKMDMFSFSLQSIDSIFILKLAQDKSFQTTTYHLKIIFFRKVMTIQQNPSQSTRLPLTLEHVNALHITLANHLQLSFHTDYISKSHLLFTKNNPYLNALE